MTGTFANVKFRKNGIKGFRYSISITYRSPSFELNNIGYLRNSDQILQDLWLGYAVSETKGIFRKLDVNFVQWSGWDGGLNHLFIGGRVGSYTQFTNMWGFWSRIEYSHQGVSNDMLRGGPSMKYPASLSINSSINSNETKKIVIELNSSIICSKFDYINNSRIDIEFDFRPINLLSLNFEVGYNKMNQKMQYITYLDIDNGYYMMSSIEQNTVDFTFRFDFNDDGEIDAVINPDFNFQEFRSNLVLRWEYIPGSVLFLVWAHEQFDYIASGDFNF